MREKAAFSTCKGARVGVEGLVISWIAVLVLNGVSGCDSNPIKCSLPLYTHSLFTALSGVSQLGSCSAASMRMN